MSKILLTIALLFCGNIAFSQIYTPQTPTVYGSNNNRIKAGDAVGFPTKDTTLLTNDLSPQIFYRPIDSSFWGFSQDKRFFKIGSGGSATLPGWLDSVVTRTEVCPDSTCEVEYNWKGNLLDTVFYKGEGGGESSGVQSVTGTTVDNTDPLNPVVNAISQAQLDDSTVAIRADKLNISDTASMLSPYVRAVIPGTNTSVDNTNPQYPVISATVGGSITSYDSTITATSSQTDFIFSSFPDSASYVSVFINGCAIDNSYYTYDTATQTLTFTSGTVDGDKIRLHIIE